ncbi:MAG: phage recombination protein Bet [Pseudomonadota bacterium]
MSEEGKELVVYETEKGVVELSVNVVREMFCPAATDTEVKLFIALCKFQGLNPFLREVYLIKYGTNPASIVTGKETFTKRANRHEQFNGYETSLAPGEDGLPISASATVYRKDREHPVRIEVDFAEYASRNRDGDLVKNWREKPKTMLRKVALVQALREAFPEDLGGLYEAAEITEAQVETISGPEVPAGRPVQNGQSTPHAASKPPAKPPQQPAAGGKPVIRDPEAPATEKQINAVCGAWADQIGYPFSELKGYLTVEDKSGQLVGTITKQQASDLIGMSNQGDFDPKRWQAMTNVLPNIPPPEGGGADA